MEPDKDVDIHLHFSYEAWLKDHDKCVFWDIKPGMMTENGCLKLDDRTTAIVLGVAEGFVLVLKNAQTRPSNGLSRYEIAKESGCGSTGS